MKYLLLSHKDTNKHKGFLSDPDSYLDSCFRAFVAEKI